MFRAIAVAGLAASFAASAANIQKCADPNGGITYQDHPCARGTTIGSVPRETAQADPAALQRLERERLQLERAADAQIAAQTRPEAPVQSSQQQTGAIVPAEQQAGVPVYSYPGAIYGVDPTTGAVIVPGTVGTGQVVVPPSSVPTSTTETASAITPAPTSTMAPITQLPTATPNALIQAAPTTPVIVPSQVVPQAPAILQSPGAARR